MQFKTKRTRLRRSGTDYSVPLSGGIESATVIESGGTPYIRHDREVSIVEDETVIGAVQFKAGQRSFPALYGYTRGKHPFIGETVDARLSGDGSTWVIRLRVLDKSGDYVTIDDQPAEIEIRESHLTKLDDVGVVSITPGHSINTNELLRASHTRKLVEFRTLHRVKDCDVYGPQRPDVEEDDEHVNAERRDVPEEVWRLVSQYADKPHTVEDYEWTEKMRAVCLLVGWLRQGCPRKLDDDGNVQPYVIK